MPTNTSTNEAKTLLIVSGFWPTKDNPISGIFVVQQIAAFASLGVKLTIVVEKTLGRSSSPYMTIDELHLPRESVRLVQVSLIRLPERLSVWPGSIILNTKLVGFFIERTLKSITSNIGRFDGCIVHVGRYMGLSIPTWRHHVTGKIAMVIHGVDPFLQVPVNVMRVHSLFKSAGCFVDRIVLVGKPLLDHVIQIGLSELKIEVIHNGTNIPRLDNLRVKTHELASVCTILSVSNLIPLKGIDFNLRALAQISHDYPNINWKYRIVGDGAERYSLEKLSLELGIQHRVVFLGRISYEDTMNEISMADIFSLPSWNEAFGIVYLEAMARGCPVIGCFNNGAQEIITHGFDGLLVEPQSNNSLIYELQKLISHPNERIRLGINARKTSERFTWHANAEKLLEVLGLCAEHSSVP